MVPGGIAAEARRHLLDPRIVVPPLLWLVSRAADDVTGGRVVASLWDPTLPPAQAAEAARRTAGWMVPSP
jgi:3-oxoacyl-[acyl-carrier protein] reductase